MKDIYVKGYNVLELRETVVIKNLTTKKMVEIDMKDYHENCCRPYEGDMQPCSDKIDLYIKGAR